MQETKKDEVIQGVNTVLFAGLKHKESIGTHGPFNTVSSGKNASSTKDDYVKG
jgi:hypothetical protein